MQEIPGDCFFSVAAETGTAMIPVTRRTMQNAGEDANHERDPQPRLLGRSQTGKDFVLTA
jgi:hypothetical protein